MKKRINLLLLVSIMLLGVFSCVRRPRQEQPATKKEIIETMKGILQEYGFASNQKSWAVEIDECSITVEYEKDARKHRIVYPTYGIDRMELEESETIYVIHYHSDVATFTDFSDDDELQTHIVPFMHVNGALAKDEMMEMMQQLGDSCIQAHTRYYVIHGWLGHNGEATRLFTSKVIGVYCFLGHSIDQLEKQYEDWYKSKYGNGYNNHIVTDKAGAYEAESYDEAVKYHSRLIGAYRKENCDYIELEDEDFSYLCENLTK